MKNSLTAALIVCAASLTANTASGDKFEARPIGVLHADAATYFGDLRHEFPTGVAIPDVRIGADGSYGNWKFRILVAFSENKVKARDIYVQYQFDEHNYIRGGHFVHQYGYQNSSAAFEKPTMVAASCESAFNHPQRVGVAYVHTDSLVMLSTSIYTPDDVIGSPFGKNEGKTYRQSFGMKCRTALHPFTDSETLIGQIGFSALFETPHSKYMYGDLERNFFSFSVPFPTKVHNETALSEFVTSSRNRWEVTPDILIAKKHIALEGQYYFTRVNRHDDRPWFRGQGFYVNLRGILLGGNYIFSNNAAGLATPAPGSLEGILTFDYTDMGYNGVTGKEKIMETAAVLNYYINKYMTVRLRGGLTHLPNDPIDGCDAPADSRNLFTLQTRFQLIF